MITCKKIIKNYGDLQVLKGIDAQIEKGTLTSIVGKSGAGKTTLLQILGTLDKPTSGSIEINGTQVANLGDQKLSAFRNQHIGFVFQFHQLLPEFNALENICLPAYIGGKGQRETEKRAMELLEFLSMTERKLHKPSELSGGEQQRIAIARALINQPEVIFADEPTGNLDSQNANDLQQLLQKLKQEFDQTIVVVTHDEEFAKTSDQILRITDGQLA